MARLSTALVASLAFASRAEVCKKGECQGSTEEEVALLQKIRAVNASSGLSSCPSRASLGGSTIWSPVYSSHSCAGDFKHDVGFACEGDDTSIHVDMSFTKSKPGCYVWSSEDCQWPMKSVSKIEFDVEWVGCERLWMCPLWTFSYPWAPRTDKQGLSGETDFVEECPLPDANTNLGCYDADQGANCKDGGHWAPGQSSSGVKHMVMTFEGP